MLGSTEPSILCVATFYQDTLRANIEVRDYSFSGIRRPCTKADKSRGGHMNSGERELRMRSTITSCGILGHMLPFGTFFSPHL